MWIGHSTFLINNGDLTILTDPIFSERASPLNFAGPKRLIKPVIKIKDLPEVDVITISHNHYDHLDINSLRKIQKKLRLKDKLNKKLIVISCKLYSLN